VISGWIIAPIFCTLASAAAEMPEDCTATTSAMGATTCSECIHSGFLRPAIVEHYEIGWFETVHRVAVPVRDADRNKHQARLRLEARLLRGH
jgi:hypothetical protein